MRKLPPREVQRIVTEVESLGEEPFPHGSEKWQGLSISLDTMITDITSKTLHEKTGQVLDRLRRGERFRVLRDGEPEALMVPVEEAIDPEWPEIMAEVMAARKQARSVWENPILKERKARNYAACGPVTPSKGLWHPPRG